jgi:hypothetical protein
VNRGPAHSPKSLTGTLRFSVAVREADLGPRAAPVKVILFALASAADEKSALCYPGGARLAKWTGLSLRRVRSGVRRLKALGAISLAGRKRAADGKFTNLYRLEVERLEALAYSRNGGDGMSPGLVLGSDGLSPQAVTERHPGGDGASPKHTIEHTKEHTTRKRVRGAEPEWEPIPLSADLFTPELDRAWGNWQTHLREKGKALTSMQARQQLDELRRLPAHERVAVLERAVSAGWARFFPLNKPDGGSARSSTPRPRPAMGAHE